MAKVMLELDTAEKTMSMTWNGKKVDNVSEINVYKYYGCSGDEDQLMVRVTMATDEDDTRVVTYMMNKASELEEQPEKPTLEQSVARYLKSRR